jgi:hypothetical protein
MRTVTQTRTAAAEDHHRRPREQAFALTLSLDGITAHDYLQWVRDPDPPSRDDLKLLAVTAPPLGDHIRLEVLSAGDPPPATIAAHALGFPMTADVIEVHGGPFDPCQRSTRRATSSHARGRCPSSPPQ